MSTSSTDLLVSQQEIVILPVGTTLYHGSKSETISSFASPTWFSLDHTQSYLHALDDMFPDIVTQTTCSAFMHVFRTTQPLSLIRLRPSTFIQFGKALTGKILLPFGRDDYILSSELCSSISSSTDGWLFYEDQRQVMLCRPNSLQHISSDALLTSPEHLILCELINTLTELVDKEIKPVLKKVKQEKLEFYYALLANSLPRPHYITIDPTGKLVSADTFDFLTNKFILNPDLLNGWQALYIYDPATMETGLSSMLNRMTLR